MDRLQPRHLRAQAGGGGFARERAAVAAHGGKRSLPHHGACRGRRSGACQPSLAAADRLFERRDRHRCRLDGTRLRRTKGGGASRHRPPLRARRRGGRGRVPHPHRRWPDSRLGLLLRAARTRWPRSAAGGEHGSRRHRAQRSRTGLARERDPHARAARREPGRNPACVCRGRGSRHQQSRRAAVGETNGRIGPGRRRPRSATAAGSGGAADGHRSSGRRDGDARSLRGADPLTLVRVLVLSGAAGGQARLRGGRLCAGDHRAEEIAGGPQ